MAGCILYLPAIFYHVQSARVQSVRTYTLTRARTYSCVSLRVRKQPRPRLPAWGLRGKAGGVKARKKKAAMAHPTPANFRVP